MTSKKIQLLLRFILFSLLAGIQSSHAAQWTVPHDFPTIQAAIDNASVMDGDTIWVDRGTYAGATVTKSLTIHGHRKAKIVGGPVLGPYAVGFRFPKDGSGSGSTIQNFRFRSVDLPIYAELTDSLTIKNNSMKNAVQCITNWGGSSWRIVHNTVKQLRVGNAGGIAIFIGDRDNVLQGVTGNLVLNNRLQGKVSIDSGSVGEFRGAGVALFAAYSGGASKAEFISSNLISENVIAMESNMPELVDFVGIELSEAVPELLEAKIFGNIVLSNRIKTDEAYGFVPEDIFVENEFFGNSAALPELAPSVPPGVSLLRMALPDAPAPGLNPI